MWGLRLMQSMQCRTCVFSTGLVVIRKQEGNFLDHGPCNHCGCKHLKQVIVSKHRNKEHHGFFGMKMTLNPHSPGISIGRSFNSRVPRPILRLANVGSGSLS